MRQFFKYIFPVILLVGVIAGCEKQYESIETIDTREVADYIRRNNINVTEYGQTGIHFQVVNPGTGKDLDYSDQVAVVLTIKSIDGKYASLDTFALGNRYYNFLGYFNPEGVRTGLKEVLKKKGGEIRMIIPSRLAFGRNGVGDIPGNASLDISARVVDQSKIAAYDDQSITKYLAANNLTGFSKTPSGAYYKVDVAGTGSPISRDSTVSVEYTGKFLNGSVFERIQPGSPVSLALSGFIDGWQEIIPFVKEGGSIRMILPSSLAYGLSGTTSIPPFSCLDFVVKVTDVKP